MKLEFLLKTWKNVYSNWKYWAFSIIIAILFYTLNVLISNWSNLVNFYSTFGIFGTIKFFFSLFYGFKNLLKFHSYISLLIISILLGVLFSLLIYKTSLAGMKGNKKIGLLGSIGIFLAAFAPGCAACGIGLAALLGIGAGVISFFPYDGLELSVIAILILVFTIVHTTKNIYVCKIKFPKKKRKRDKK